MHVGTVFCVSYPLMHSAWAVFVCTVAVSRRLPLICHLLFTFPLSVTHWSSSLHSSIVITYVLPFYMSPRQPALVRMDNIKALHFNEQQLFKASFGGMIWLCMYWSLTLVFSLCSSPQRSSFRIPSCELKGSSRCECVLLVQLVGRAVEKR